MFLEYTNVTYLTVGLIERHRTQYTVWMSVVRYYAATHDEPFSYHICHTVTLEPVWYSSSLVMFLHVYAYLDIPPL